MESTALWGGVLATMAHEAISNGNSSNEILLTSSTGVLGGAIAGSFIGDDTTLTESRVRYLDLGGLTGALVAGGIYASFEPKDAPAYPHPRHYCFGHRRRVVHRFSTHPRREYASARAVKRLATSTCSHENTRWQLALSQLGYVLSGLD